MSLKCQLFAAQRAFAVDMARREAVRDVWQQRNELTQTLLIVATLLFGCAYTTLVDGSSRLPLEANKETVAAFSFFVSVSLLFLLLSIVILVALYRRISQYDIHRPLKRYAGCGRTHRDFNSYYKCHCDGLQRKAIFFFYVGSATTYVGCSVLLISKLLLWQHDNASCILYAAPIAGGLIFVAVAAKVWPDKTHSGAVDYGGLSGEQRRYDKEMTEGQIPGTTTEQTHDAMMPNAVPADPEEEEMTQEHHHHSSLPSTAFGSPFEENIRVEASSPTNSESASKNEYVLRRHPTNYQFPRSPFRSSEANSEIGANEVL